MSRTDRKKIDRLTNRQIIDIQKDKWTDRKKKDRQTDRQADRQTDKQTNNRLADRQRMVR